MLNNKEIKEWFSKNEILELYPIGLSTYKKRIKKLSSPPYKNYSRILNKSIDNSNLKSVQYLILQYLKLNFGCSCPILLSLIVAL